MPAPKLTESIILAAIEGFESQKAKLDLQIVELKSMLSGVPTETAITEVAAPGKRRRFSAASRRKMALAQQKRWAAAKGASEQLEPATAEPVKAKRKRMSASARKAIGEATRQRWALRKAAEASATKASKKSKKARAKAVKKAMKKSAPAVSEAAV
jgi:hypothetical protein